MWVFLLLFGFEFGFFVWFFFYSCCRVGCCKLSGLKTILCISLSGLST